MNDKLENNEDIPKDRIKEYDLLIQCIESDQVSSAQLTEHLKDEQFARYYNNYLNRKYKKSDDGTPNRRFP